MTIRALGASSVSTLVSFRNSNYAIYMNPIWIVFCRCLEMLIVKTSAIFEPKVFEYCYYNFGGGNYFQQFPMDARARTHTHTRERNAPIIQSWFQCWIAAETNSIASSKCELPNIILAFKLKWLYRFVWLCICLFPFYTI